MPKRANGRTRLPTKHYRELHDPRFPAPPRCWRLAPLAAGRRDTHSPLRGGALPIERTGRCGDGSPRDRRRARMRKVCRARLGHGWTLAAHVFLGEGRGHHRVDEGGGASPQQAALASPCRMLVFDYFSRSGRSGLGSHSTPIDPGANDGGARGRPLETRVFQTICLAGKPIWRCARGHVNGMRRAMRYALWSARP